MTKLNNPVHMLNILDEVESLLEKHAIETVPLHQIGQGFYSTFFVFPKRDGGMRPILNLKPINDYLQNSHFKMESLRSIIQALQKGDWAVSLDLKDAYLQIPVFPPHRKFLRFCINGIHYQFRAMPFGIAIAPRVFTKIMAAVGGFLRSHQIHIYMYLDDWLVKNQLKDLLLQHLRQTVLLLVDLGLIINLKKSHLLPSQRISYLGAMFDLQKGIVYPTEERFSHLQEVISSIMENQSVTASLVLRLLGLMASCIDIVPYARLHMRPLQLYLLCFWQPHRDSLFQLIPVKESFLLHLHWWKEKKNIFKGVPLQGYPHSLTLWTDASTWGWGAHLGSTHLSEQWPVQFQTNHINWLELKAIWNALIKLQHLIQGQNVLVRCDNSTVVAYVNKQGGTKSPSLCILLWDMFQWCLKKGIHLFAAHIPGRQNCLADSLSRGHNHVRITEWSLHPSLVQDIFRIMGTPNIDLFATRNNHKLQVFCSPVPDPLAYACDALAISWKGMFAYAFPPPILIPKVLLKVRNESCVLLLVAPCAPHQSWFPQLLELLIDIPIKLPIRQDMLSQNRGQSIHPNPQSLNLAVWKIAKDLVAQEDFLKKLQSSFLKPVDSLQENYTRPDYEYSEAGVLKGISVPLRLL